MTGTNSLPTVDTFSIERAAFVEASKRPVIPSRYVALTVGEETSTIVKPSEPLDLSDFTGVYTEFDAERNQMVQQVTYVEGKKTSSVQFNPTLGFAGERATYDSNGALHGVLTQFNPIVNGHVISETAYEHGVRGETKRFAPWPPKP